MMCGNHDAPMMLLKHAAMLSESPINVSIIPPVIMTHKEHINVSIRPPVTHIIISCVVVMRDVQ